MKIVPEAPDGSYTLNGARMLLRVQADVNVKVAVGDVDLPRRAESTSVSGWFEPSGKLLESGSRNFFWEVETQLPVEAAKGKDVQLTIRNDTTNSVTQPSLAVTLRFIGRDPAYTAAMPRPSEVFVDNTENTKEDNRMETSIVTRGVTLAGWLFDPHRNDGPSPVAGSSEDWHYDIFLDPDFIERNYNSHGIIEPIRSAVLPGNVVPLIRGPATPVPLLSPNASLPTSRATATAFTLPGNGIFTAELNAWHTQQGARGAKPSGWVDDPDAGYSGNAWPFNPLKGTANPAGSDLKAGDYVIISGTLWQDTAHSAGDVRECFDTHFKGHGGWLEIHPVDTVRRVDPPKPRKHVVGLSSCYPVRPNFDTHLKHVDSPPSTNSRLRYQVIVDDRFTSPGAVHAELIDKVCEPPLLRVTANTPVDGTFNATYILWWEEGDKPRDTEGAYCVPSISPILGGAAD